mgnify:CR=1 FL=1
MIIIVLSMDKNYIKIILNNTKKEKLETQRKLLEDKKKLIGIANNIVYGY